MKKREKSAGGSNFSLIVDAVWKLSSNYVRVVMRRPSVKPCGDPYQPSENKMAFRLGWYPRDLPVLYRV